MKRPFREEGTSQDGGNDSWIDNMMKTLSETSIGRMYEKPVAPAGQEDAETDVEGQRLPPRPDRLVG